MKRRIILVLLVCCVLGSSFPAPVAAQGLAVGSIIGLAGAVKAMLDSLIDDVSAEVQHILEQAYTDAQALETNVSADLKDIERMTMSDIDAITSGLVSDVDSILQDTMAQLLRAGRSMDEAIARQIRDALSEALVTWQVVSRDLDQKIARVQRGVAVIMDNALIQVIRIVFMVGAFVVVIIAVVAILRRRNLRWAVPTGALFLLLLLFALTPLFPRILSTMGLAREDIPLNGEIGPPSVLWVTPFPVTWHQTGTLEIVGLNLLVPDGPSQLLAGAEQDDLRPVEEASFSPAKAIVPLRRLTEESGNNFLSVQRADGKATELLTLYVSRPEAIPIIVEYRLWQEGQWQATESGLLAINRDNGDHGWTGGTTKCDTPKYTNSDWTITSWNKTVYKQDRVSELEENIEGGGHVFSVHFCLKSTSKWTGHHGRYKADYTLHLERKDRGNTSDVATQGTKTLYLDPESGSVSEHGSLTLSDNLLSSMAEGMRKQVPLSDIISNLNKTSRETPMAPISRRLTPEVAFELVQSFARPDLRADLERLKPVQREILLGKAPVVSSFTPDPDGTRYSVIVKGPDINKTLRNKQGTNPIYDDKGDLVMTVHTDAQGQLWLQWLYVPS